MVRHRRMLAPINTNKHYVHRTNQGVGSGTISVHSIVDGVVAPAVANAQDVRQGAVVKAVHLEYWLWGGGTTGLDSQFNFVVMKLPSGLADPTAAQLNNLGSFENKKNVFFSSQGVLGAGVDGNQAIPVIRDWMLIPKGKQRIGLGDKIIVALTPTGTTMQFCGLTTYKEYT